MRRFGGVWAVVVVLMSCGDADPKNNVSNNGSVNNGVNNGGTNNGVNNGAANNGGTGGNPLLAANYSQSCNIDSDCIPIGESCCSCGGAAIAAADQDAYQAALTMECADVDCPEIVCPVPGVACGGDGMCRYRQPQQADPEMFDQTCETVDDCVAVAADPCGECRCSSFAISASAQDAYDSWEAEQDCNPGPSTCECEAPTLTCSDAGTCELN